MQRSATPSVLLIQHQHLTLHLMSHLISDHWSTGVWVQLLLGLVAVKGVRGKNCLQLVPFFLE